MSINLSEQAQQRIGKNELVVITERVDDVALLLAQMIKMGLPQILDRHLPKLPKPWQQEGPLANICVNSQMRPLSH